ncbi:class F sortase [Lentzea albida]|uniref:Sortase family protein n=1 Tax=Lentzea albida TaxID=65499 RepID=A0A1H9IEQ0_9PSEU|nr:Sortase family protein [Lentzea albida]
MPPSEPTEIRIPKIDVVSSLVPLGLNADETVEVPPVDQPMQAGWYRLARTPGEAGPAVVLGHVDGNQKPGIFFRLKELVAGDEVVVSRKDGTTAKFRVHGKEQVAKDSFPAEAVYGDTDVPGLRLITCGGSYDQAARSYRDNVIVYATLI